MSGWWARAWQEPYRLFFPWGMLVGILGVALWPLFYAKLLPILPNILHARLMIVGWGGAMVLGFLSTAGPRMLGVERFSMGEVRLLWMVHAASLVAFFRVDDATGCGLFAAALVLFSMSLASRLPRRKEIPPARFVLVLLGLLCGFSGALLIATGWDIRYGATTFRLARLLLDEGFLLLPALGLGGFLFPRIAGLPAKEPTGTWARQVLISTLWGLGILLSFYLEASGSLSPTLTNLGLSLRLGLVLLLWSLDFPRLWTIRMPGTQGWMLRLGLIALPLAWIARLLDPIHLYAVEHILFISGFGVLMLVVAARVVDGHSGQPAPERTISKPLRWIFWLAALAMLTRVTADYKDSIQVSHYIYAALTWAAILIVWLITYWGQLNQSDTSDNA